MSDATEKELRATAHRIFSAECFNQAWALMDLPPEERTEEQEEEMLRLAMASHWHWTRREDYGLPQASVAHWQISRIFALLGQADNCRRWAGRALESALGNEVPAFYRAYACEALARAARLQGDEKALAHWLERAREEVRGIQEEEHRDLVLADLREIEEAGTS